MVKKITVIGAGTWGIALARLLALKGLGVSVWSALPEETENLKKTHEHPNLKGVKIPETIDFNLDLKSALDEADMVLLAVPSVFVRSTSARICPYLPENVIIVDVAKGMEEGSLLTMSEIIESEIPFAKVVALTGPTHAEEVSRDLPTAIVASCEDEEAARLVQEVFMTPNFRVYTNPDKRGVEFAGAIKNVMALGVGISRGIGCGDNATAALITRGLAEIVRLGVKMGCRRETFYGLAGVGDLIVTCTSVHSRNYHAGCLIGSGKSAEEAKKEVGMVVEGINMLPAAVALMEKYDVEMPIVREVNSVVRGEKSASDAVNCLMERNRRGE